MNRYMQKLTSASVFFPSILLLIAAVVIGWRNSSIFEAARLIGQAPTFALAFFFAFCAVVIFSKRKTLLNENLHGLILFFLFTASYFLIASLLNKPEINTNNIYFAADSRSWYLRMAAEDGWNVGTRAVHPLTYLIFRPIISLISIITAGDRFHANLILLALAGGACVFIMWKIVLLLSENQAYAVLSASLLGLSASHLIFATVVESYIFSTLCLLVFIWLIVKNKNFYLLVITGILTFGITITNIVSEALIYLLTQRNIKKTVIFIFWVVALSAGLNILSRFIYPATEYFFVPENILGEQRFSQEINLERLGQMTENLLIYNVVAPQPYVSMRNGMPRFNFLIGTIQNYIWFGWPALILWIMVLIFMVLRLFLPVQLNVNDKFLSISMLSCLIFNFLLHISYGTEPFLYSADWTYALILLIAINFKSLAEYSWFTVGFLLFIMMISINNLWLLYFIARQVSEFLV